MNIDHENILERFKFHVFQKRLHKELIGMQQNNTENDNKIELELTDTNEVRVNIYSTNQQNEWNAYGFVITYDYPFRPPRIFYQNRPYVDFLRTTMNNDRRQFRRITGYDCFCCSSISCANNWRPSFTLKSIISEIQVIKQKKRDFINKLMVDKIKRRYLVADIDLDSWLF